MVLLTPILPVAMPPNRVSIGAAKDSISGAMSEILGSFSVAALL
jgi:hypothetical protein